MLKNIHDDKRGDEGALFSAPMRRDGKPEEVAKAFAYLLSDESSYVSETL